MPGIQEEFMKCLLNKCHPVSRSRPNLQAEAFSPAHQRFSISEEPLGNSKHVLCMPGFATIFKFDPKADFGTVLSILQKIGMTT